MRGKQIATSAVCVGLVLALAGITSGKASAQVLSSRYDAQWTRPYCMQPYWDESKWEDQNMRWDIKLDNQATDMSGTHDSIAWHDRWFEPNGTQPYWDEQRWENHMVDWHNQPVVKPIDLSNTPHSMHWEAQWNMPFFMQPAWDEGRWEEHCMNWNSPSEHESGYRHKDTADMD